MTTFNTVFRWRMCSFSTIDLFCEKGSQNTTYRWEYTKISAENHKLQVFPSLSWGKKDLIWGTLMSKAKRTTSLGSSPFAVDRKARRQTLPFFQDRAFFPWNEKGVWGPRLPEQFSCTHPNPPPEALSLKAPASLGQVEYAHLESSSTARAGCHEPGGELRHSEHSMWTSPS